VCLLLYNFVSRNHNFIHFNSSIQIANIKAACGFILAFGFSRLNWQNEVNFPERNRTFQQFRPVVFSFAFSRTV